MEAFVEIISMYYFTNAFSWHTYCWL